jgi:hypothetical protein
LIIQGSNPGKYKSVISSSKHTDQLWCPLSLYSIGTKVLSQGYSSQCMQFTPHLHLVPKLRMSVQTGKTLPEPHNKGQFICGSFKMFPESLYFWEIQINTII